MVNSLQEDHNDNGFVQSFLLSTNSLFAFFFPFFKPTCACVCACVCVWMCDVDYARAHSPVRPYRWTSSCSNKTHTNSQSPYQSAAAAVCSSFRMHADYSQTDQIRWSFLNHRRGQRQTNFFGLNFNLATKQHQKFIRSKLNKHTGESRPSLRARAIRDNVR